MSDRPSDIPADVWEAAAAAWKRPVDYSGHEMVARVILAERQRHDVMREALEFYADAWSFSTNKRYGGLEWKPKEELLDDCGNRAKEALK